MTDKEIQQEIIEIEKVSDYRWKENQQLKQENEQLKRENKQLQEHLNKFSCNEIPDWNCKDCFQDLKQSLDWSDERESELIDKIKELETQIENMKNCANIKIG